jgi:hypothetical protein
MEKEVEFYELLAMPKEGLGWREQFSDISKLKERMTFYLTNGKYKLVQAFIVFYDGSIMEILKDKENLIN